MSENSKNAFETPVLTVIEDYQFNQDIAGDSGRNSWSILDITDYSE